MLAPEVHSPPVRSQPKRGPRCGMNRPSPLTQALDLQAIAMSAAKDPNVPPHIKAALMRAWTDLQDVVMAIRGHGRPKPVTARNDASATRRKPKTLAPLRKVEPLSQPPASSAPAAPSQDSAPGRDKDVPGLPGK